MTMILVLALVLLGVVFTTAQESTKWTLMHSFDGRNFVRRGQVVLQVEDGVAKIEMMNDEACMEASQIQTMMAFGLYQLKLVEDGTQNTVLTSVPSCQLRRASFRDELTVTLNAKGSAISLTYAPLVSPLAPSCDAMELPKELPTFSSKVYFDTAVPGMVIPILLPTTVPHPGLKFFSKAQGAASIPGVNPEGNKPNQSFFLRYWYMILPFAIMSLMGPAAEQAPPAPVGVATPTGGLPPASAGGASKVVAAARSPAEGTAQQRRAKRG